MTDVIESMGRLSIDLGAIRRNWTGLSGRVQGAEVAAVVKANAYGLGVGPVAKALYLEGCRAFYVSTLAEAHELRSLLADDAEIYLLGGVAPGCEASCVEARVIPVIGSLDGIKRWLQFQHSRQASYPVAVKFDSGMGRFGLSLLELNQLLLDRDLNKGLDVRLFISHFACADEPDHPMNAQQLAAFRNAAARFQLVFPAARLSLANSSGCFLSSAPYFDQVRCGACLYGVNPQPGRVNPVEPVVSLALPILQIRCLDSAQSIGYGAEYRAAEGDVLAVVRGGYADGLNRLLGERAKGILNGVEVSRVGRVSMDSVVFDVSAAVSRSQMPCEGEYIVVLDAMRDFESQSQGMTGYEYLTSLGSRYHRVYVAS